ncbi:hypothetical protein M885DRAFT_521999 [Pelagophyceae sp. CCMP2097]|nr:hypothetical protein M885DRAFT_521999 [Pelagophyceae sp. CCMP2097]
MPSDESECRFLDVSTRKALPPKCGRRKPQLVVPLLVACVGGAGSWHTALELRGAGLAVEHERVGTDGAVSWTYAVRDTFAPYPGRAAAAAVSGDARSLRFRSVLHLVRCPAANVAALSTHKFATLQFAAAAVGIPLVEEDVAGSDDLPHVVRSERRIGGGGRKTGSNNRWLRFLARLWLRWNEHIERFADVRVRVEDGVEGLALCQKLGLAKPNATSCTSSASRVGAASAAARSHARRWSNWFFANGEYNPKRCIRGDCAASSNDTRQAKVHHRAHANVTWHDLSLACGDELAGRLKRATARYGYGPEQCFRDGA